MASLVWLLVLVARLAADATAHVGQHMGGGLVVVVVVGVFVVGPCALVVLTRGTMESISQDSSHSRLCTLLP